MSHRACELAAAIARSYLRLTGENLVTDLDADSTSDGEICAAMYTSADPLLCHDGTSDPLFNYANRAAQELFELTWDQFVGMPSRLSAGPGAQAERNQLISEATESGYYTGYSGIRVSHSGREFEIQDAVLWRVTDEKERVLGLACRIPRWHYVN